MMPAGAIRGDKNIAQPRTSAPPGRRRTAGGRLSRRPGQRSGHCFSGFPELAGPGGPSGPVSQYYGEQGRCKKKAGMVKKRSPPLRSLRPGPGMLPFPGQGPLRQGGPEKAPGEREGAFCLP